MASRYQQEKARGSIIMPFEKRTHIKKKKKKKKKKNVFFGRDRAGRRVGGDFQVKQAGGVPVVRERQVVNSRRAYASE